MKSLGSIVDQSTNEEIAHLNARESSNHLDIHMVKDTPEFDLALETISQRRMILQLDSTIGVCHEGKTTELGELLDATFSGRLRLFYDKTALQEAQDVRFRISRRNSRKEGRVSIEELINGRRDPNS